MKHFFFLIGLAALLSGCEKIVAEDISNKMPVLLTPASGSTVSTNPVHFKWEEMDGASKYHLMVVSPSFSNIQTYALDTLVTGTDFYYSLDSNQYELKLVGVNGGYRSDTLGPIGFIVNTSGVVTTNEVVLTSPADNSAENSSFSHQFTWEALADAATYEISIREGSNFSTGTIIDQANAIVSASYTTGETLTEGVYMWGVKAFLDSGDETSYTTHTLYIDETTPNDAVLTSPLNNDFVSQGSITFVWNNGTDPGTVNTTVYSFLEVSADISFLTLYDSIEVVGNSSPITINTSGVYYWRVTNYDAAGNTATTSTVNQFTVL